MNTKQKIKALGDAFTTMDTSDGKQIVFSDGIDIDTSRVLSDMVHGLHVDMDTAYQIVCEACSEIANADIEEIKDGYICISDVASPYRAENLKLLSVHNHEEIAEIIRDHKAINVAQACAIWYEQKVEQVAEQLISYINF
jgi:hypothetical protein